ncbi:O-antigen ligase family protein [Ornithinimicrobium sp. W1665]|uniref:O-antigen ligase family protein n=1 Tax=Ornithinimicrobium sp. W1665 TaxID=3416666 RepID=UPI003CED1C7D
MTEDRPAAQADTPSTRASTVDLGFTSSVLVVVLAATFPVVQLVKTVVDRATTVRDLSGAVHFVSEGRTAPLLEFGAAGLAATAAVHLVVRSLRGDTFTVTNWALLAFFVLLAEVLRGRSEPSTLLYAVLTLLVVLAAGVARLEAPAMGRVGAVAGLTALSVAVFTLVDPTRGWATCRPDKCTAAGGLLRGYFPQENVLGMYLATLLPTVAFIDRPVLRRATLVLVTTTILLTGSRTGAVVTLAALWSYAIVRRRATRAHHGDAGKVVGAVPLITFLVSGALVFTLPDMSLTGRGLIYRLIREAWSDQKLLGPGRETLYDAYYSSMANWYLAHEHGQGAYVLGQVGLVGAVLFLLALGGILRACWASRGPLPAIFALAPALGFLTEPIWEISLRSPYFVSLFLTVVLVSRSLHRDARGEHSLGGAPALRPASPRPSSTASAARARVTLPLPRGP